MDDQDLMIEKPEFSTEEDAAAEAKFIAQYIDLTHASETQARSVYIYSDILQQKDPYRYHLE